MDSIKEGQEKASETIDEKFNAATEAMRSGAENVAGNVVAGAEFAKEQVQSFLGTAKAHSDYSYEKAIEKLQEVVAYGKAHKEATAAVLGGAALLALPSGRRLVWRWTIGRFQSEESLVKSAEHRLSRVGESIGAHEAEAAKLSQRAALAVEEWQSGQRKAEAAWRQLSSLAREVHATEKSAAALVKDLKRLPSKQALQLRMEAATKESSAKRQRQALERTAYNLEKKLL